MTESYLPCHVVMFLPVDRDRVVILFFMGVFDSSMSVLLWMGIWEYMGAGV